MASTRNERRRRWFLRTWSASGWLADWRATVRAAAVASPLTAEAGLSRSARLWPKLATDTRVPSGVSLLVRRRHTGVTITLPLTDPYLLIGNHPRCQLQLDGTPGQDTQYALFWLHGELYGVDLRMNQPQSLEFRRMDGWWSEGQTLRLGDDVLQVRGLPGIPARTMPLGDDSTVSLHLESPEGEQQRHLTRWLTLIGCAADNGVIVRDRGIAARQAALIRTPTSLWIVNLADGLAPRISNRVAEWSLLDPLDEFSLGETKARVATTWPDQVVPVPTPTEYLTADLVDEDRRMALQTEWEPASPGH